MGIQVTRSGTNWTVDVTSLGLVNDPGEKDFIVIVAGVEQPLAAYTKTTATVITYSGIALPTNTVVNLYRWGLRDIDILQYGEVTSQLGMNRRLDQIERVLDDLREVKEFIWNVGISGDVAVASHVALADPHVQYRLKSAAIPVTELNGTLSDAQIPALIARDTEVAAAVVAHEALPNPHPGYTTAAQLTAALTGYLPTSQKGAVNGIAPLDGSSKIPAVNSRGCSAVYTASTGVWLFTWADGSTQTIDTPLELVFQSVNYNTTTKQVTFTLVGGATTTFSLTDLVDLPEVQIATSTPASSPTTGQRIYLRSDNGDYYVSNGSVWVGPFLPMTTSERAQLAALPTALSSKQPLDADLTSLAGITTLGVAKRTSADTWETLTSGTTGEAILAAANTAAALTAIGIPLVSNVRLRLSANNGLAIVSPIASTGFNWTAIGNQAAANNTTGNSFIAIGDNAGVSNLVGSAWTAIGQYAGAFATGNFWTAIGQYAGYQCQGNYWLALGTSAGFSSTTGANWLAFGLNAGYANTIGSNWQAIGISAGGSNVGGSNWQAYGIFAGSSNVSGSDWFASGLFAGGNNTSGSRWFAFGSYAGFDSTTGSDNIFFGHNTGRGVTTGSGNTVIGNNVSSLPAALTNTVILASGDGAVKLTSDATGCRVGTNNSDSKLKLISPNGTVYSVSVTDAGVLTIAV